MEFDFTTRHHLDSLAPHNDPSIAELLNQYKKPPTAGQDLQAPVRTGGGGDSMFLSNLIGQLQGAINSLVYGQSQNKQLSGLQLNVNADILRWFLLLVFVLALVFLIIQIMHYRQARRNPLKKRLKKLEKEIKALRAKKNPEDSD